MNDDAALNNKANAAEHIFANVNLQSERLVLRAFTKADIDGVFAAAAAPSTQIWLPMPEPGTAYTRKHAELWCVVQAPAARASGDGIQWAAHERLTGEFVGSFGLTRTAWKARNTEVGYWVAPWARGKGFAPEAVACIARWALVDQEFQRLELKAATGNRASQRVAEKVGFTYEGTERNAMPLHEGRTDLAVFSLIPGDLELHAHTR